MQAARGRRGWAWAAAAAADALCMLPPPTADASRQKLPFSPAARVAAHRCHRTFTRRRTFLRLLQSHGRRA